MQRRARRLAAAATALALGALTVPLGAAPAAAIDDPVGFPSITPVTWLQPDGRQVAVTNATSTGTDQATLRVRRDALDGQPDGEWATVVDAPDAGLAFENRLAATDDGIVSIVWRPSGCPADAVCDRTFTTYDPLTGTAASAPTVVEDAPPLRYALDDGSYLLADGSGPLTWRGPDGSDRGTSPIAGDAFQSADVDVDGKLLVLGTTATVARMAVGGAVDLTLATDCLVDESPAQGDEHDAIGAAPDGGFAVACGDFSPYGFDVIRYDGDGVEQWRDTSDFWPEVGLVFAERVTVTPDDTVWVGGHGWGGFTSGISGPRPVVVGSFTSTGPGTVVTDYFRRTYVDRRADLGGGIVDLRTIGDEVAFADLQACCRESNATYAGTEVHAEVLPWRPTPPACTVGAIQAAAPTTDALDVSFQRCLDARPHDAPDRYRVDATWDGGATTVEVPDTEDQPSARVDDLPSATVVHVTVTPANDLGDSTAPAAAFDTVLPFSDLEAFAAQQVFDLRRAGTDLDLLVAALAGGGTTPALAMQSLLEDGPAIGHVEPVARLYRAFFQRDPDPSGLRYWRDRHVAGVRLARIAEQFARSTEFRRTYGALDDRAFVEVAYWNVLGRLGDAGGVDYWTRQLTSGRRTWGDVMTQLSESPEHRRRVAPIVEPLTVSFLMLGRLPTSAERERWTLEADPYATIPSEILGTEEYRLRVTG